jgi:hypothetical protein
VLAAVLAVVAGCDGGVKRVPVSGTVMLDGQPLTGGILHFAPDVSKGNEHRIDCLGPVRNGKFNLMTQAILQRDNGSGVPPGWYKVYLFVDPTVPTLNVNVLPQFTSAERTPLSVEVVENPPPGAYDFKMTSK